MFQIEHPPSVNPSLEPEPIGGMASYCSNVWNARSISASSPGPTFETGGVARALEEYEQKQVILTGFNMIDKVGKASILNANS